jgi:hypothetical protein
MSKRFSHDLAYRESSSVLFQDRLFRVVLLMQVGLLLSWMHAKSER